MSKKIEKGYFITLEGGEGSGKTTLLTKLSHYFTEKGHEILLTYEPGATLLGKAIRDWLLHKKTDITITPHAELLLFLADRAQHLQETIIPALKEGKIVLCDRFNDSTIAYQGSARGLGVAYVQQLCHLVCGGISPDLTLFLNVSPEIGLLRSRHVEKPHATQGSLDRIESEELAFHFKIQEAFHSLAEEDPMRIHCIEAHQTPLKVFEEAVEIIHTSILMPLKHEIY
jgi:dTMP kinase